MNKIEKLAEEIKMECLKEGEPISDEEALEMAKMELKEKQNRRYEKTDAPRKKTERKKKENPIKREILSSIAKNLTRVVIETEEADHSPYPIFISNPEKQIDFILLGENYSITLTKHRPKK